MYCLHNNSSRWTVLNRSMGLPLWHWISIAEREMTILFKFGFLPFNFAGGCIGLGVSGFLLNLLQHDTKEDRKKKDELAPYSSLRRREH